MIAPARMRVTGLGVITPGANRPDRALGPRLAPIPGWFEVAEALPGRGYRRLPAGCLHLLAAARAAALDTGPWFTEVPAHRRAAVVGTNNAGAALIEEFDRTIIDLGAAELPPARVPYMAMSMFAARLAPEHLLRGFDLTTNSPAVAGLDALQSAARALAAGRASVVLAGAVEEPPSAAQQAGARSGAVPADIGAAVVVCEPEETPTGGAGVYGYCSTYSAFLPDPDSARAVLEVLWEQLAQDGAAPHHIDTVLDDSAIGAAVAARLTELAPDGEITTVPAATGGGCLTPVRRVVGRLGTAGGLADRVAVVAASAHGHLSITDITPYTGPPRSTDNTNSTNSTDNTDGTDSTRKTHGTPPATTKGHRP
ncbi:beta-ketoacyl synthase N-terminal-like domain-containing protein [Embleya sp. NPDC050154]|uniref:beta-ketoacyl synthase N-terminal-like domain-containing protein n=1 Tax=Embleya sp. NPDC050154 TaxID=3363988 RepID=UPI0037B878B3